MAKRSSSDDMKIKNLVQLVSLVVSCPGINRKKISTLTGLSNQTVTNLAKELIDDDIVREFELEWKGPGRPPIGLEFNYARHCIVTVDITYNNIRFFLNDLSGKVKKEAGQGLELGCHLDEILLSGVRSMIEGLPKDCVSAVIITCEGVIDEMKAVITFIKSLGVKELDVRKALKPVHIPVFLINDVNLISFDMQSRDSAMQNWLTVKYSSGMGCSTAINRHISKTGLYNMPGKLSHIKIHGTGEHNRCWCGGENCLGTFFCKDGLEAKFGKPYMEVLEDMAKGNMPEYTEFMQDSLASILSEYVTLIGVERIYFTGPAAEVLGKDFFDELSGRLKVTLPFWIRYKGIELVPIKPVAELSSKFFIHFFLTDIFEYINTRDEALSNEFEPEIHSNPKFYL